jgi:hypothetical protein
MGQHHQPPASANWMPAGGCWGVTSQTEELGTRDKGQVQILEASRQTLKSMRGCREGDTKGGRLDDLSAVYP